MIVAKCPKCGNIGCNGILCGYKTMHENAANINPYSIEEQVKRELQRIKRDILKLDRYDAGHNDSVIKVKDGDYTLLYDILALFSNEKLA